MKKYQQLVQAYSEEISSIKNLQDQENTISQKLDEAWEVATDAGDGYDPEVVELEGQLSAVFQALQSETSALSHEIEIEYWEVPFAKPRKQGIGRFFEVAGI